MKLQVKNIYPYLYLNNILFHVNKNIILKYTLDNNFLFKTWLKISFFYFLFLKKNLSKSMSKNRSLIEKSNKKPWKQKGLGRARVGSYKSPLLRGGGVIFGPKNKTNKIIYNADNIKLFYKYLFLNKRTNILFIPIFNFELNTFKSFKDHLKQQLRLKGVFSENVIYIRIHNNKINIFSSTFKLLKKWKYFNFLLKTHYIIFLI